MLNGKIFVDNIICETLIGIYPEESLPQPVEFGFSFVYNWEGSVESDSIELAVDYHLLTQELVKFISKSRFNLLESLTFAIAKKIKEFSSNIISVKVYCKKINALPGTSGPRAELEL